MTTPFDILLEDAQKSEPHVAHITLVERSGKFRLGEASRPLIGHDGGHLATFGKREPTAKDRAAFAAGLALLEGSEALNNAQTGAITTFGDLADANAAYRHFLFGKGAKRKIDYERYIQGDAAGKQLLLNVLETFKVHAEIIGQDREKFSITSEPFNVGNSTTAIAGYPATQNWRKTLGAHFVWVSADVRVSVVDRAIKYSATVTIHMEDMYNFNPGDKDMDTSIPDSINGRLETSGLAYQYLNYGTVTREVEWIKGSKDNTRLHNPQSDRSRKPSDNRRLRNNI